MERGTAHLHLEIETGSEPIAGSISRPDEEPTRFRGWIELAEAIETARLTLRKTGVVPWGEGPVLPLS